MYNNLFFGIIIGIVLFYLISKISSMCWISNSARAEKDKIIQILLRQLARWHVAAKTDPVENPLIKNLHSNYSIAYFEALNSIATSQEIERMAQMPYEKIRSNLSKEQDETTKALITACPQFAPFINEMSRLGGEGI